MPNPIITTALNHVANRHDLDVQQAQQVLQEIMSGQTTEVETAGMLLALRTKGETVTEIAGFARAMRNLATPVEARFPHLLDTAGTGGGKSTLNVSTAAALVAAAAGRKVAKHGNRSATSKSGSADVLESLGAKIDLSPRSIARCIEEVGFGFMFAPDHHAAMRFVAPVRKQLGVRTVFNILGPLTNPAEVTCQVMGVSEGRYIDVLAGAFAALGVERALVVSSTDGLDEFSISAPTQVAEVSGRQQKHYTVTPADLGVATSALSTVAGGSPSYNAALIERVFAGQQGPPCELIVMNAGAAIYAANGAKTLREGVALARSVVTSGAAAVTLKRYVELTHELV